MKKCGVEAEEKLGKKSKLARCSKLLNWESVSSEIDTGRGNN